MSFTMKTLTEGIRQRHMGAQHQRLTEKWNRTGLLRGLTGYARENMSVMLENQAAQLLRETNSLGGSTGAASGDIRGFQNVAFPIVRRVFGGLVANELVSVQPMSLPSGLLFYLDYTYGNDVGGRDASANGVLDGTDEAADGMIYASGQSIYNNPTGKGVQSGSIATGGQYDLLGSGYSRRHDKTAELATDATDATGDTAFQYISLTDAGVAVALGAGTQSVAGTEYYTVVTGSVGRLIDFDSEIAAGLASGTVEGLAFALAPCVGTSTSTATRVTIGGSSESTVATVFTPATMSDASADFTMLQDFGVFTSIGDPALGVLPVPGALQPGQNVLNFRRHTKRVSIELTSGKLVVDPIGGSHILFVMHKDAGTDTSANVILSFPIGANLDVGGNGDALTIPSFESSFTDNSPTNSPVIPEIDIKIESLAVTAVSRKLKAKWSPELAQDLNAYHSLDAEVELTQILSEQIALELDREVLNDLLTQANGANLYWSRAPGKFVNKLTGAEIARNSSLRPGPQFTGTVRDWYETLSETIIDAANIIHRKTLRGSANFIVIGPDIATILESSVMYKPSYSIDGQGQVSALSIGAEKIGNLSNRFTVYKDPYFPRNKILVGYKGGSYLETGYVYAPYVPLIVTPTIFAPEDFTPRKGVMTRYGKKMVRSDFYGTVTCMDMNII